MVSDRKEVSHNRQKKIAVINDFSGFGRCSIAVCLPIISAMKIQCCPLPTAIFSNHTGFESFFLKDCTEYMEPYAEEWKKLDLRFDGIMTGFLGSCRQIEIVSRFFGHFHTDSCTALIDPVMGDYGELYPTYSEALAESMHELVRFADILTPNLTEACILTGRTYREDFTEAELESIAGELSDMGPEKVVISGLSDGCDLLNYVYQSGCRPEMIREHKVGGFRSGTGDVFSSIIAADAVNGWDFAESVRHASSFIAKTLRCTIRRGIPETDGICFEEFLCELGDTRCGKGGQENEKR